MALLDFLKYTKCVIGCFLYRPTLCPVLLNRLHIWPTSLFSPCRFHGLLNLADETIKAILFYFLVILSIFLAMTKFWAQAIDSLFSDLLSQMEVHFSNVSCLFKKTYSYFFGIYQFIEELKNKRKLTFHWAVCSTRGLMGSQGLLSNGLDQSSTTVHDLSFISFGGRLILRFVEIWIFRHVFMYFKN